MAGYFLYSLDWPCFQNFVERPSMRQVELVSAALSEGFENEYLRLPDSDPMRNWFNESKSLESIVAERLILPDWYNDLSRAGKELWEFAIFETCFDSTEIGLDFRPESEDSTYFEVFEVAWRHQDLRACQIDSTEVSAFGRRPFRYFPERELATSTAIWSGGHSMHTPQQTQQLRAELQALRPIMETASDRGVPGAYHDYLMPAIENVTSSGRVLLVQVDT